MDLPSVHRDAPSFVSAQHSPAPGSSAADTEMTVADCWFAALDQRPFISGGRLWITRVFGVHLAGFHTWIQLEFAERPGSSFLLHLAPWAGLEDAISSIRSEILRAEA